MLSESTSLNGSAAATVSYSYDPLGRMQTQTQGSGAHAITSDHAYNIRGWLTSKDNDYFRMKLRYCDPVQSTSKPSYTGNISEWSWRHGAEGDENTYAFTYDNFSRLVGTTQYLNAAPCDRFRELGMLYDQNSNLTAMMRRVDDRVYAYTYKHNGNQLKSITTRLIFPDSPDVKPMPIETSGFSYDPNGNLVYDAEHSLSLSYNHLNLIEKVERGGATLAKYSYLSDGTKLSATDGDDNGLAYSGSLVYNKQGGNLILESAGFNGGRIIATNHGYDTRYFITDHLGSTRVVVNNAGDVLERNDYYPYGTRWEDQDCEISDNRYRYNGKEDQTFINLPYMDYGARMYNGTQWFNIDPLAEIDPSISPYVFCGANPIKFVDPDGRTHIDFDIYEGSKAPFYQEQLKDFNLFFQEKPFNIVRIGSLVTDNESPNSPALNKTDKGSDGKGSEFENSSTWSADEIFKSGATIAGVVSQLDSPLPGPADVAAAAIFTGTAIAAGVVWSVHQFAQHGSNNVGLSPEELEVLKEKEKNGTLNNKDRQKLKKHAKNEKLRHSRHSKDQKKPKSKK